MLAAAQRVGGADQDDVITRIGVREKSVHKEKRSVDKKIGETII